MRIIWHITTMAMISRKTALTPPRRDRASMALIKRLDIKNSWEPAPYCKSHGVGSNAVKGRRGSGRDGASLHGECLVQKILAAFDLLGEVLVGGFASDLHPGVVLFLAQADHFHAGLGEGFVHALLALGTFLGEVGLGLLGGGQHRFLLFRGQALEAALG